MSNATSMVMINYHEIKSLKNGTEIARNSLGAINNNVQDLLKTEGLSEKQTKALERVVQDMEDVERFLDYLGR